MRQKELALALRGIVVLCLLAGAALGGLLVPALGLELVREFPEVAWLFWPCLIGFWLTCLPVLAALVLVWRMAARIGRDNSFCMKNALRLRTCSLLAAADTVYYIIGGVVLLSMNLLHIGIAIIGLGVCAVGAAISVLCAALSHLTRKAADMRSENDLTI